MGPPRPVPPVGYFRDEAEVYDRLGHLMTALAEDEELGPRLAGAETTVRWEYRNPDATITVKLTSADVQIDCGPSELEPEVVMAMDADIAHRFWLGQINVAVALSRGQIRASGPVYKMLRLVPLIKPAFPIYKQQLLDEGRGDLTAA